MSAVIIIPVLILLLIGGLVFASQRISIYIDGIEIESDVAPQLVQDRTMVPIRVITEHFGADVGWVQETRTVEITSPYQQFMDAYEEKGMYIMQASDVLAMVEAGTVLILDVRSYSLREDSYISGSRHIPMPELLERLDHIPKDRTVAVYCVKNINAAYAVAILNMHGYEAYLLENGMDAWKAAGGQTVICAT